MLSFKPKEFLHVLRKIERLLREAVVELKAIRELQEEFARPRYVLTGPDEVKVHEWICGEGEDSSDASWKWRARVDEA